MSLPIQVLDHWLYAGGYIQGNKDGDMIITEENLEKFLSKIVEESARAGMDLAKQAMLDSLDKLKELKE